MQTEQEIFEQLQAVAVDISMGKNVESQLERVQDCIDGAIACKSALLMSHAFRTLAQHYLYIVRHDLAQEAISKALSVHEIEGTSHQVAALVVQGVIVQHTNAEESFSYLKLAVDIDKKLNGEMSAWVAYRYGEVLGNRGQFAEGYRALKHAERLYEVESKLGGRISVINRITVLLDRAGELDKMVEYAAEGVRLSTESGLPIHISNAYKFLGYGLYRLGRLDESTAIFLKALKVCDEFRSGTIRTDCLAMLGSVYIQRSDFATGMHYLATAYTQYKELGFTEAISSILTSIGDAYGKAGDLGSAVEVLESARDYALASLNTSSVRETTIVLAKYLIAVGESNRASELLAQLLEESGADPARHRIIEVLEECASTSQHKSLLKKFRRAMKSKEQNTVKSATIQLALQVFKEHTADKPLRGLPSVEELLSGKTLALTAGVGVPNSESSTVSTPTEAIFTQHLGEQDGLAKGIEVRVLGGFVVLRNGVEISTDQWKRKKARDVFKYLVTRHKSIVTPDEIITALWGEDVSVESCLPTLQNAISSIRTALEPQLKPRQPSTYLNFTDGAYELDLGADSIIDLDQYFKQIDTAKSSTSPEDKYSALKSASKLYVGDLLPHDRYEEWTQNMRQSAMDSCIDALSELSDLCFDLGKMDEGIAASKRVIEIDSTYEDAYGILISNLTAEGREIEAAKVYKECKKAFSKEYGSEPPRWLRNLLDKSNSTKAA